MNKFLLFFIVVIVISCNLEKKEMSKKTQQSSWPQHGIAYEIFVQSFYDSNGDSIGDIPGMTEKLDYLKELDINAVWLMPIMPSPSYHKYDVTDYRGIHPDYGTMDDFKKFVHEAHQKDIKVIIDFIINHTSSEHPWFKDAISGPTARYRDYYVWGDKDSIATEIAKKETSFDSGNIRQWHAVNGDEEAPHYYGFFYGGMPDLNYDNPAVRKEIYDIGKFWLEEVGVDGFRMDAARHIYPDDRAQDNHNFWIEFKSEMEKVNPDVYIVGEVWANTKVQAPFSQGFTALFDFDLAFSILESVRSGKAAAATITGHGWAVDTSSSFVSNIISNNETYLKQNPGYIDAIFLSNHDQDRVMSVLDDDVAKAKMAASVLMTLPGTPYIYYGEEIGMKGTKPDPNIREPFLWKPAGEDKGRPTWMKAEFSTDGTVTPLSQQKADKNSIFNHYKRMIKLRNECAALNEGDTQKVAINNPQVIAFTRSWGDEKLLVIHNISNEVQEVDPSYYSDMAVYFSSVPQSDFAEGIPAMSTVIFK